MREGHLVLLTKIDEIIDRTKGLTKQAENALKKSEKMSIFTSKSKEDPTPDSHLFKGSNQRVNTEKQEKYKQIREYESAYKSNPIASEHSSTERRKREIEKNVDEELTLLKNNGFDQRNNYDEVMEDEEEMRSLEEYKKRLMEEIRKREFEVEKVSEEVVDCEVELSALLRESDKNYELNCELKFELETLQEEMEDKEVVIVKQVEDVKGQIYEMRACHENFLTKIDQQRDSISKETENSFLVDLEPIKSKYAKNNFEIEEMKKEINFLKSDFQKLRGRIIENARSIERRTAEEVKIQTDIKKKNLLEELRMNEEMIDEIREKVDQGAILSQKIRTRYEKGQFELVKAEKFLEESSLKMDSILENQLQEIATLKFNHEELEREIQEKIEDLEEEKIVISQNLDEYEQEYQELERENKSCVKVLDEHLENGIHRIKRLDDAIKVFEKESAVLRMKNRELTTHLNDRLNMVLEQNLNKDN